ncbi:hypothetical protein NPIL_215601 [Nephila pilipes]|uniref:Uncharacterized protein n=1 Tax=Nephila pilipes TaxID=299642 RepID=A0A8X6TF99_NEPPI|nr:hypothetical protein NPIL_215601 [Nephila pilipes]
MSRHLEGKENYSRSLLWLISEWRVFIKTTIFNMERIIIFRVSLPPKNSNCGLTMSEFREHRKGFFVQMIPYDRSVPKSINQEFSVAPVSHMQDHE